MKKAIAAHSSERTEQLYVVRVWDGSDHCWTDLTGPVSKIEADGIWVEKTQNGTAWASYDDGDYFCVFPANTRMLFRAGGVFDA